MTPVCVGSGPSMVPVPPYMLAMTSVVHHVARHPGGVVENIGICQYL